jgi:hypothetical protein
MVNAVVFDVGETLISDAREWRAWADWIKRPAAHLLYRPRRRHRRGSGQCGNLQLFPARLRPGS